MSKHYASSTLPGPTYIVVCASSPLFPSLSASFHRLCSGKCLLRLSFHFPPSDFHSSLHQLAILSLTCSQFPSSLFWQMPFRLFFHFQQSDLHSCLHRLVTLSLTSSQFPFSLFWQMPSRLFFLFQRSDLHSCLHRWVTVSLTCSQFPSSLLWQMPSQTVLPVSTVRLAQLPAPVGHSFPHLQPVSILSVLADALPDCPSTVVRLTQLPALVEHCFPHLQRPQS